MSKETVISLRMPSEIYGYVSALADCEMRSLNAQVLWMLEYAMTRDEHWQMARIKGFDPASGVSTEGAAWAMEDAE